MNITLYRVGFLLGRYFHPADGRNSGEKEERGETSFCCAENAENGKKWQKPSSGTSKNTKHLCFQFIHVDFLLM